MLQTIEDFGRHETLKADVCIAGGGPAGIALALTLAERGVTSVLLEAGPVGYPDEAQRDPYKGVRIGRRYPLESSRLRCLGGTSRHWGGWCKPLDAIDFEQRPNAPLPSWPIGPDELAPYYPRALEWCEIPSQDFDPASSVGDPGRALLDLESGGFENRLFRFSPPTRFDQSYGDDLAASEPVRCVCSAALNRLDYSGDRIRSAIALGPEGRELTISADRFVLAMGGIEIPRFLLHMAAEHGARHGMEAGLVGEGFMDHFGFHPGYLEASGALRYFRHEQDGLPIMPVLTATEAAQRQHDWPSICVIATPGAPEANLPPAYFANPGIVGAGVGETQHFRLQLICEPTAHRASRVALAEERDAYGMRRILLDWNIVPGDFEQVERFMGRFERAVGAAGAGRVQRTQRFVGEARRNLSVGWHHMGTTRMSDDPRFGVVDAHCRVHGAANLYIASSSVFPRVGYSNPTLAIIAFAERLAAHLVEEA